MATGESDVPPSDMRAEIVQDAVVKLIEESGTLAGYPAQTLSQSNLRHVCGALLFFPQRKSCCARRKLPIIRRGVWRLGVNDCCANPDRQEELRDY
jgi:hypothetical protein